MTSGYKPVATLILNRNLPEVTDRLVDHLREHDGDATDIYVIESGSIPERRSRHASFVADWPEAVEEGLRFARGFNFGLAELARVKKYDYYFLVCQDSLFPERPTLAPMLEEMQKLPLMGILSPASPHWGETKLIPENETRLFWFVNHVAWLFRSSLIDRITPSADADYMNYLYDGTNFRGYCTDIELVAKAYINDMAVGITRRACFEEDADLTDRLAKEMRTDPQKQNRPLMYDQGMQWMKKKYGFSSRWQWITYIKAFYNEFFENHTDYAQYRV